ncbi:hypothetical protein F0L74_16660 [Chitinophaga agrisoli]|uniref:Uncharacterized protein n=1 Tax=Chitinophaga agrisoli TaxID=2607653 RepID=A0A5B2VTA5_9BACT|nr:hypothetical protein [Chitinophaga agrisoli]KAA2241526.1 hypothetical protein F0L74_16660 [Chitinophaga agrisoli]
MANEMPQELIDEIIQMDYHQFDYFEKKWKDNLNVKADYERQYYSQVQGYIEHNKTFNENKRPLKPLEYSAVIDQELVEEARTINLDRAVNDNEKSKQQPENPAPPPIGDSVKSITARLFAAMKYETLKQDNDRKANSPHKSQPSDPKKDIDIERG